MRGEIGLFDGLTAWVGDIGYGLYYLRTGTGVSWLVPATVLGGLAALGLPWLAGLVVRFAARADDAQRGRRTAEAERAVAQTQADQAEEIARLREDQARLARDVHDVVGHSLAVILAQAESAQYADADDPVDTDKLKRTMATIADSARTSLRDVRGVLQQGSGAPPASAPQLDQLVEGVRAAGHEVAVHDEGTPRPLPPELAQVASRVLQEMLTNAIRHGRRHAPVEVERHWPDGRWEDQLRLEVTNLATPPPDETQPLAPGAEAAPPAGGQGLPGMRRRLESVGGRLDVRRRSGEDGVTWTVTAWVPVRSGAADA